MSNTASFHRRGNPWPEVKGMLNRKPDPACPLCRVWGIPYDANDPSTHRRQHEHATLLWQEWDGRSDWPSRVADAASQILSEPVSPEQARRHYRYHRPEQPAPPGRLNRERALASLLSYPDSSRQLISHIYRQRMLTFDQIVEIFYRSRLSERSAHAAALSELLPLIRNHALYRWFPPEEWATRSRQPRGLAKQAFYFLGREGAPWIEERFGIELPAEAHVQLAKQIGLEFLVHDMEASEVFVHLHRSLRQRGGTVDTGRGNARASLPLANWYGTRQTQLRLWDRIGLQELDMRPDGFCSLVLERSFDDPEREALQMPFFYEWDRGTKDQGEVAQQMFAYHRLALSEKPDRPGGIVGERFPALAIRGYAVPLVMIFNDRKRVESVQRSFLRLAAEHGITNGVPLFITDASSWRDDPFAPGIFRLAWDEKRRQLSLIQGLLRASRRLVETGALPPHQELAVDWANIRRHSRLAARDRLPSF